MDSIKLAFTVLILLFETNRLYSYTFPFHLFANEIFYFIHGELIKNFSVKVFAVKIVLNMFEIDVNVFYLSFNK